MHELDRRELAAQLVDPLEPLLGRELGVSLQSQRSRLAGLRDGFFVALPVDLRHGANVKCPAGGYRRPLDSSSH